MPGVKVLRSLAWAVAISALGATACHSDDPAIDGGASDASPGDTGGMVSPEAQALCGCLLIDCHDPFHLRYGEADEDAIRACEDEVDALPHSGSPSTSGNSLECRATACEGAARDQDLCAAALGAAPCQ